MQSSLDPALREAYLDTDYIVSDDPPMLMRVGESNPDLQILLASFGVSTAAFITAWNPGSKPLSDDENNDRQMALLDEIEKLRLNYLVGYGEREDWREYSYFIMGIERATANELASQFGQLAYIWTESDGTPQLITME